MPPSQKLATRRNPLPVTLDVQYKERLDYYHQAIQDTHDCCSDSTQRDAQLRQLEQEELDYHMDTCDILFNYYESLEQEHHSNQEPKRREILDFFKPRKKRAMTDASEASESDKATYCRATLLERYLSQTDPNYSMTHVPTKPVEGCPNCHSEMRKTHLQDGFICCDACGDIEYIITDNEKPSYKEPPKEISYFSYARINHFQELCTRLIARLLTQWWI